MKDSQNDINNFLYFNRYLKPVFSYDFQKRDFKGTKKELKALPVNENVRLDEVKFQWDYIPIKWTMQGRINKNYEQSIDLYLSNDDIDVVYSYQQYRHHTTIRWKGLYTCYIARFKHSILMNIAKINEIECNYGIEELIIDE